jgi:hypothetical protein
MPIFGLEKHKQIAITAAELQCPMRFKYLTRLHQDTKRELWAVLDEETKAKLTLLGNRYTGPVRYR